jgi:hypothetical protein
LVKLTVLLCAGSIEFWKSIVVTDETMQRGGDLERSFAPTLSPAQNTYMRTQVLFLMLLLSSGSALAQSMPDFCGVFLRERIEDHGAATVITGAEDPLILDIKQDAYTLRVTEEQHGVRASVIYELSGNSTMNAGPDGVRSKDQVNFHGGRLILKSEWTDPNYARTTPVTEQTWELSPDLETLTIQPKLAPDGRSARNFRRIAIFARQASLQGALEKAQAASGMNKCSTSTRPPPADLGRGVVLGYTGFQDLVREVEFEAHLRNDFFSGLSRTGPTEAPEFRKNGRALQTYDGSLGLGKIPFVLPHPRYLFLTTEVVMGWGDPHLPEWLLNLQFHIKWVGPESRDVGELPAELESQPWSKNYTRKVYQIAVPARDVPLTDTLEVHILSAAGTQLGCIRGHI